MKKNISRIADELEVSRSHLYVLMNTSLFDMFKDEDGNIVWSEECMQHIKNYLARNVKVQDEASTNKSFSIQNRRYLGNKYRLLDFIKRVVEAECKNVHVVADVFSGTGVVASTFTDKKIITNDILYSNYICNYAWFAPLAYSKKKLQTIIDEYNKIVVKEENYMSINFADTYFSEDDCKKIDYIREDIEQKFKLGEINQKERALLIMSLLYAMDRIANTCGHYDAYRKGVAFDKSIELLLPNAPVDLNKNNICYNTDANELAKVLEADLVYIDPPYNSRQYCDTYHLLENVARWEKPEVSGVARKMDRSKLKSEYCTKSAAQAFENLVKNLKTKYILLSYNNMATKGNDRSNARITDEDIMRILSAKGEVKVFEEEYRAFSAGKSNIGDNKERLFLCICKEEKQVIIPSALNYTGGKHKILSQMLPNFPNNIENVYDIFCGGCNVGINVPCKKVVFNDSSEELVGLLNTLRALDKEYILCFLYAKIAEYKLSLVSEYGYEYYNCDSAKGLAPYNKEGYLKLRNDFNSLKVKDEEYYLLLYLLVVYSFNNQIRFNKKGEFNLPVGKRDFNAKMKKKLVDFIERIKNNDYEFTCMDFRSMDVEQISTDSLVYADPPYLITCATYNESKGWTEQDEHDLLAFLDALHAKNVRFALSNILESKGKRNDILKTWLQANSHYRVIDINHNYANSNYQTKNKESVSKEVLIVNY